MEFPLTFSFKIIALASQFSVVDARGNPLFYVKQKLLKLKESVTIFRDHQQTYPLFYINADRVLDISARYTFTDSQGRPLGALKRQGMRSIWKAHYEILHGEVPALTIREENPWAKVMDTLFGQIPILGLLGGYLFHPAYLVSRPDGTVVMRLQKQPALFEGKFRLDTLVPLAEDEELRAVLALLMMVLLERERG